MKEAGQEVRDAQTYDLIARLSQRGYVVVTKEEWATAGKERLELTLLHSFVSDLMRKTEDLEHWRG